MKQRKNKLILLTILFGICIVCCIKLFYRDALVEKIKASTVVNNGDFSLTAENRWDSENVKSYVDLNWDSVHGGYRLFQSSDAGATWEVRSTSYEKEVKVLNVYPEINGLALKNWMEDADIGLGLIKVTPLAISSYNNDPEAALFNSDGTYKYDVIMFGTWDSNNSQDLNEKSRIATKNFIDSGRGVLFGHDTVWSSLAKFDTFKSYLGITTHPVKNNIFGKELRLGSTKVKVTNDGYLMKYPHELANSVELTIPFTHSAAQMSGVDTNIKWLEFLPPFHNSYKEVVEDSNYGTNNHYLITNNNVGLIQTGHSNGTSTTDEMKILVNTLYNLAQVSAENYALDHTVKDDKAPKKPETPTIRCGDSGNLNIKTNTVDVGKKYQWYVEASSASQGIRKSDVVEEEIVSNVAGYFYELSDSPTSNLKTTVEGYKDSYGRIAKEKYSVYIAPDGNEVNYSTETSFNITPGKKYLHILAVDRANNVGEVGTTKIDDMDQYVNFNIERTHDEARLVDIALDSSINNKMKSLEIQFSENIEIKDFNTLALPNSWFSFENSTVNNHHSVTFAMENKNDLTTIRNFLIGLRFTIKNPVNQSSDIRLVFHEKVYTSWLDENNVEHYYTYVKGDTQWPEAYNKAKLLTYKGLTGYLATIKSEEEHDFIYNNIAKNSGWLGGTRVVKANGTRINNEPTISVKQADYDTALNGEWYWANGPEVGQVFFDKATYEGGGRAPLGMYEGFNNPDKPDYLTTGHPPEPNGEIANEVFLEFAYAGRTKYWNDYGFDKHPADIGYYVEFSEYGGKTEGVEISDVCWQADVPQKISLKAIDGQGNPLPNGNLIFDENLRIGQNYIVEPESLELYDYIKITDLLDNELTKNFIISKNYQGGKVHYALRKSILHIRQVILNENAELVVPTEGAGKLTSYKDGTTEAVQQLNVTMASSTSNTLPFNDYLIRYTFKEGKYIYTPTIPSNYELVGYVWSDTAVQHSPASASLTQNQMDVVTHLENWLTVYIKPINAAPAFYHWDYEKNDFGELKNPEF